MAGMGTAAGFGAGEGADMLQRILLRVAQEEQARERAKAEQQRIALTSRGQDIDMRGQDFSREASQGNLALGNRNAATAEARTAEDVRQFDELAPVRASNIRLQGAQAGDIERRPEAEATARDFTTTRDRALHGYQLGEIGAQGANAMRLQAARLAAERGPAGATPQQQNEVNDALDLVRRLGSDKSLESSVGPIDQYLPSLVSMDPEGVSRFRAGHDQLTGILQLAQGGKLKGQGAVSDAERRMLANAATSLKLGLGKDAYRAELARIKAYFERAAQQGGFTPQTGGMTPDPSHGPSTLDILNGRRRGGG